MPHATAVLTDRELAAFCAQAGMLLQAGIPFSDGLAMMQQDTQDLQGREILQNLAQHCEDGLSFSQALAESGLFPGYLVRMVSVGETAGRLDKVLAALAHYYERQQAAKQELWAAVRYPLVMIGVMVLVVGVLVAKVLPIFQQVFAQLGVQLTGPAAGAMRLGQAFSSAAAVLAVLLVLAAGFGLWLWRTRAGQKAARSLWQHSIFTRRLSKQLATARFFSAFALVLASGMEPERCLELALPLADHPAVEKQVTNCQKRLEDGEDLAGALQAEQLTSGLFARMMSMAFRTGTADNIMQKLADEYAQQTEQQLHDRILMVEPFLVAVFSVVVGVILLSVMLPLTGILAAIG